MTERDFNSEFRELIIGQAAQDRRLRGFTEWMLTGKTQLVSESFLDTVDYKDLEADIGDYYGLDEDGVDEVFDRCEAAVEEDMRRG